MTSRKSGLDRFSITDSKICRCLFMFSVFPRMFCKLAIGIKIFKQTSEMTLKLTQGPSVKGMSKHFVVYGEKI